MKAWNDEKWWLLSALVAGFIVGLVTGYWKLAFLGALLVYFVWHAWHFIRLLEWLRLGAVPNKAPDLPGAWESVVGYVYGVQRRNQQRKGRLRSVLDRFKQIAVALPDGTVVLRGNYEIDWANQVAETLLGIKYPQDAGRRIGNLIRNPAFHAYLKKARYEEPLDVPSPVLDHVELNIRIIPFGDGEYLLTARDISSFMRVQAMRRDFVANVSHELRTPLTVMTGYLESLLEEKNLDEEHRRILASIEQQASRMLHIVKDLLELSRLESDPSQLPEHEIRMPVLLETVQADVAHLVRDSGHELVTDIDQSLLIKGGEKELHSLAANLVHNAIRHTPRGTRIVIKWQLDRLNRPVLRVEDNGRGIEREHIPRLTERFYRVDAGRSRDAGGSGLGLAIVKHIMQRHGGSLEIESESSKGASFICVFPARRGIVISTKAS
jgi:two-component system phosphate regulon sensor histidine kinase PhoR